METELAHKPNPIWIERFSTPEGGKKHGLHTSSQDGRHDLGFQRHPGPGGCHKLTKAYDHNGVVSLDALINLSPLEIEDLTYYKGTNMGQMIDKGLRGAVFALQAFHSREMRMLI